MDVDRVVDKVGDDVEQPVDYVLLRRGWIGKFKKRVVGKHSRHKVGTLLCFSQHISEA